MMNSIQINLTLFEIDTITMALMDNGIIGKLTAKEKNTAWNLIDKLYYSTTFYNSELNLIHSSLTRYATKYNHEKENANNCTLVANYVLSVVGCA